MSEFDASSPPWDHTFELWEVSRAGYGESDRDVKLFETIMNDIDGEDAAAFVGGSVWSLEWRPKREGQPDLLALSTRPKTNVVQNIHELVHGNGCLQFWRVSIQEETNGHDTVVRQVGEMDAENVRIHEGNAHTSARRTRGKGMEIAKTVPSSIGKMTARDTNRKRKRLQTADDQNTEGEKDALDAPGGRGHQTEQENFQQQKTTTTQGPELSFIGALSHEGKITWDLAWHPYPEVLGLGDASEGALALALGNGMVELHEIPAGDQMVAKGAHQFRKIMAQTNVLVQDRPCTLQWNPGIPLQLLVGCWSGHVSILTLSAQQVDETNHICIAPTQSKDRAANEEHKVKNPLSNSDSSPRQKSLVNAEGTDDMPSFGIESAYSDKSFTFQLVMRIQADECPLRSVRWAPLDFSEEQMIFATSGHSGVLKIWDIRDPYAPQIEVRISREWLLHMEWSPRRPRSIVMCVEDGTLRVLSFLHVIPTSSKERTVRTEKQVGRKALWSASISPSHGLLAFAGEDGEVIVGHIPMNMDKRKNLPLILCAKQEYLDKSGVLKFASAAEINDSGALERKVQALNQAEEDNPYGSYPHPHTWITSLSWNPSLKHHQSHFLAYGTCGGFLRVLQVKGVHGTKI